MTSLRLSFIFLIAAFLCMVNSNPLLSLFGKSGDKAEAEADEKVTVSTSSTAKSVGEATTTTTTTASPSSSCGGLKGFLHICDKNELSEPTKSVKTRSVPEDSDEDSDESKSEEDDSDNESDEKFNAKEKKQNTTKTSPTSESISEGNVTKRQVGNPEPLMLGEVPPVIADSIELPEDPIKNSEGDKEPEKRQVDDSDSSNDSDEDKIEENFRSRRDCRDREGDYNKDCRRKREFVPSCFEVNCRKNSSAETNK